MASLFLIPRRIMSDTRDEEQEQRWRESEETRDKIEIEVDC
jgi:hypothetical protein